MRVLLDACVICQPAVRDLLLHLAAAVTPDALLEDLFDEDPDTVLDYMRKIRGQLKRPPLTPSQYIRNLRRQKLCALAGRVTPRLDRP